MTLCACLGRKQPGKVMDFPLSTDLTARDKGPIWIVYPRDDIPELRNPRMDANWIWQLAKIEVK